MNTEIWTDEEYKDRGKYVDMLDLYYLEMYIQMGVLRAKYLDIINRLAPALDIIGE